MRIKRALLSVSDKTGIVELANFLISIDCEIISTGGTGKILKENGVEIIDISKITNNPEAFGGRMKTLSFQIESAILFDREKDAKEAKALKIQPIDLVVCNLYPFERVKKQNASLETLVENIDIGGPTMIRAAAKNYKFVSVLCNPNDYNEFMNKYQNNELNLEYRYNLMRKAFEYTAMYDMIIAETMNKDKKRDTLFFVFDKKRKLRYGENSHQQAFYYSDRLKNHSLYNFEKLQGKEISFNNLLDINSAIESIIDFEKPACSVVKHNNPCGLAVSNNLKDAFELAWKGDPVSAFGSIIAFNKKIDKNNLEFLQLDDKKHKKFIEVVIAPNFTNDALKYLTNSANIRVIRFDFDKLDRDFDIRYLNGLLLWQQIDKKDFSEIKLVTDTDWDYQKDLDLIKFGLKAVKMLKSNAIALVRKTEKGLQLIGMGAGQPNRIVATKLAIQKAIENMQTDSFCEDYDDYIKRQFSQIVLVSDAFFPFADSIEYANEFGIKKIVQPGGSIRDKKVIKKADELGVSMIFTGLRHFRH